MRADELLRVLWARRLSVAVTFVVTVAAAAVVTFSLPKVYTSTTLLWVNPAAEAGSDFEATQLSQVLSKSFAELLQTSAVARTVSQRLPFDESPDKVANAVEVQPLSQSQLLQIKAEGSSPARARAIGNTYARVFIDRAAVLRRRGVTGSRVNVAEPATTPGSASRPKPKLYLLVAAILGFVAGAGVALLRERFDQRLQVDSSTTELLELPVIGRVPRLAETEIALDLGGNGDFDFRATPVEDAFRLLLTNLAFLHQGREPATVAVVSPGQAEGKSTCALNLARAAMEVGMEVLVVDADLRRPSLARAFGVEDAAHRPGLSNFLVSRSALDSVSMRVPGKSLRFVPSGPTPPNPSALLRSPALADFDRQARGQFQLVIYDTPPLTTGPDASIVAAAAEAVILIVDANKTRKASVLRAVDQLKRARANLSGVVVNRFDEPTSESYYRRGGVGRGERRPAVGATQPSGEGKADL